jgi:hypothetical protein
MNAIGKLMLTMNRATKSSENAVKPEVFGKLSLLLLLLFWGWGNSFWGRANNLLWNVWRGINWKQSTNFQTAPENV